jgi:hypothetical protein
MLLSRPVAAFAATTLALGLAVSTQSAVALTPTDVAPVRTLDDATGGSAFQGLDVDRDSRAHVATDDAIHVFERGASGSDAPSRVITGPGTRIDSEVVQVAVGFQGRINVVTRGDGSIEPAVLVFAPYADWGSAPIHRIAGPQTRLKEPGSLVVGMDDTAYVTDVAENAINVYVGGSDGNRAPVRRIAGAATTITDPDDIALDSAGNIVVSDKDKLLVFAPRANGDVAPLRTIRTTAPAMTDNSRLDIDSVDNAYVTSNQGGVVVVSTKVGGTVEPLRAIDGPATGVNDPWAIAVDRERNVHVGDRDSGDLLTFAPLVPFTAPFAVKGLKISGTKKSTKRTVTWRPGNDNGGQIAARYRFVVAKRGKVLLDSVYSGTEKKLRRSDGVLRSGRHTVTITPSNRFGTGKARSITFSMAKIPPTNPIFPFGEQAVVVRKKSHVVSWSTPSYDGGAPITSYRVVVTKGKKKVLVDRKVKSKRRSLKVPTSALATGRHWVRIQARNKVGWSKAFEVRFTVAP